MSSKIIPFDLPSNIAVIPLSDGAKLVVGALVIAVLTYLIINEVVRSRTRLAGIGGPTGLPVVGNLHQLGPDPPERLREWGQKYGGVYQLMMGNMPVVVFTSMKAARDVFIGQGGALVDRPRFYTFHGVLSSVASTIGTTPW